MNEKQKAFLSAMQGLLEGQKVDPAAGTTLLQPQTWVYGHGMFSYCGGNELVSAMIGDEMLSTWLGTTGSIIEPKPTKIIGWYGPTGTGADDPDWDRAEACADSPKVEWGKCEQIFCFGQVSFEGADLTLLELGLRGCDVEPRYYIRGPFAGQRITNEQEWQVSLAAAVLQQAFERMNIIGNRTANAFHWDGLQQLINAPIVDYRTGNRCIESEPVIYAWGSTAMSANICNVISAMVRRIRTRGRALGGIQRGNMALVMTTVMRDALIDFAGCGCGPCTGSQYNEVNVNPLDARVERARLANGGTYGMGMFEVDGIPIDIITNDWIPQTDTAPYFCSDIYILTRMAGGTRALYMEYQDFSKTLAGIPAEKLVQGSYVTDGGRFLIHSQNVNECFNQTIYMKSRIVDVAPWLQGRITNVCAPFDIPPITPIPGDSHFFAGDPPLDAAAYGALPYTYGACGGVEDWSKTAAWAR